MALLSQFCHVRGIGVNAVLVTRFKLPVYEQKRYSSNIYILVYIATKKFIYE
jgi:hypothetical protein